MGTNRIKTETEVLVLYRDTFDNLENHNELIQIMDEYGFGPQIVNGGKMLLENAFKAYILNKTKHSVEEDAYYNYVILKDQLSLTYMLHHKLTRKVLEGNNGTRNCLTFISPKSTPFSGWLKGIKKFYISILSNKEIIAQLARFRLTMENLMSSYSLISRLEVARAIYLEKKQKAYEAAKTKNVAMKKLNIWMDQFYTIAKLALDDKPKLLESLGISV